MNTYLGIDVGTSGTKTVLFDETGRVLASATKEYPLYQPQNGWAEQDPKDWFEACVATIRGVLQQSGVPAGTVKGLGLSGQMHGLVMLDENGEVLRNAILWCDQRTAKQCEEITSGFGYDNLIAITANPALTGFTASKILWVKEHEPEIFRKCRHILLPKDYVRYLLTGTFYTEVSDASGMQLLDVPHRRWSGEMLRFLGLDESQLATVVESPEITGGISKQAAALTGLPEGTPVVGGAGDNAAAAVGTGVVEDGKAFTTIGTSGVVFAHSDEIHIDPKGRVHTFCCAVPGCYHVMGVTQGAGLSLQWFRNQFCADLVQQAEAQGVDSYVLMDELAASVPPGSNRLLYLPYLMGERTPHLDPDCRGVFFGLSAIHQRKDLIRAVMEGVSFSMKDCYDILVGMGVQVQSMLACGGGGKSRLWRQMLADMYGCKVQTVHSQEGPALGVAILAMVGTGAYSSVQQACSQIIQVKQGCEPVAEHTELYRQYHRLYAALYRDLKQDYQVLAQLP